MSETRDWMKPSTELLIADTKESANTPQKQFTREKLEKHDDEKDCWIVVNGKVYDVRNVLDWYSGGQAAMIGHAGQVHQITSDEFASIHDGFAYENFRECILGIAIEKATTLMKRNAEAKAKAEELAQSSKGDDGLALQKHRWVPVRLENRKELNQGTRCYTFSLLQGKSALGLATWQHIRLGFHLKDPVV